MVTGKTFSLASKEGLRYGRHLALPEVGPEGQCRLKGSSAVVVGVGGLGIPAAAYLVSSGVGRVGLVDNDEVEVSNLHRQFIFTEQDVGRNKAEVAKERFKELNPQVEVSAFSKRLDSANALDLIAEYEVVIDASDNLPTRYLVNDACILLRKPDVYGSALGFEGQLSVFCTREGPCYRCMFPKPPPPASVKSCEDYGVFAPVPGTLGALQAGQALELLLGRGTPLAGRLLFYDGYGNTFEEVPIKPDPSCRACGENPTVEGLIDYNGFCGADATPKDPEFDITPLGLRESMNRGENTVLLDVREAYEFHLCHIEGAILIPLGELPSRVHELRKADLIVAYCHLGIRSTSAVAFLRQAGYRNTRNLKGGIDAWASQVDKTMPRY